MSEPVMHTAADAARTPNDSKHIPASAVNGLTIKILRRLTRYYRKWFQKQNHVFVHRGPFEPVTASSCEFVRYEHFEDVPGHVREAIEFHGGQKALEADRREMEQAGAMWVAILDQRLAGVLFTRCGREFHRWFVKLRDDDIVIFRMRTYPKFRGRGIAPSLMRNAMYNSLHHGDNAYIDCRVYNIPSIRSIQKAGFVCIATMKPISRKEALCDFR